MASQKISGSRAIPYQTSFNPALGQESYSVKNLKELAKKAGIPQYSKMNKETVYNALLNMGNVNYAPSRLSRSKAIPIQLAFNPALGQESYTVKNLKELAKQAGLSGYSKLKKDELLALLANRGNINTPPAKLARVAQTVFNAQLGENAYTLKELRALSKGKGIPGAYKMKKTELYNALLAGGGLAQGKLSGGRALPVYSQFDINLGANQYSRKNLLEFAKQRGIPGAYKMKKDELYNALVSGPIAQRLSPVRERAMALSEEMTMKDLKAFAKQVHLPAYSKYTKKADLYNALVAYQSTGGIEGQFGPGFDVYTLPELMRLAEYYNIEHTTKSTKRDLVRKLGELGLTPQDVAQGLAMYAQRRPLSPGIVPPGPYSSPIFQISSRVGTPLSPRRVPLPSPWNTPYGSPLVQQLAEEEGVLTPIL